MAAAVAPISVAEPREDREETVLREGWAIDCLKNLGVSVHGRVSSQQVS